MTAEDATQPQQQPQQQAPPAQTAWEEYGARDRILLTLGALACVLLFYGASLQFDVPAEPGHSPCLLQQPHRAVAIVVIVVTFFVALFVGSTFTSRVHHEGGLFCAVVGLAVLSARGGPVRYVLFEATGRSVFLLMTVELILLGLVLAGAWVALQRFVALRASEARWIAAGAGAGARAGEQPYFTALVQVLLMTTLMSLIAQTDSKGQAMAAVCVSALLATMAANWFSPAAPGAWLWAGPLVVGVIGYVSCYFRPDGMEVGRVSGYFAALARPVPLDYASLGVVGALFGYWTSSRWHQAAEAQRQSTPT